MDGIGLLFPSGKFVPCEYAEHDRMLETLGIKPADVESRVIKVSLPRYKHSGWATLALCEKITQKQQDFLFDYCLKYKLSYPRAMIERINEGRSCL